MSDATGCSNIILITVIFPGVDFCIFICYFSFRQHYVCMYWTLQVYNTFQTFGMIRDGTCIFNSSAPSPILANIHLYMSVFCVGHLHNTEMALYSS
jgi:hypothetical protein